MSVKLTEEMLSALPDARGHFGAFGGRFVSETLMDSLMTLEKEYARLKKDSEFQARFDKELADYVGRPTPLYFAERLSRETGGAQIWLKREDLAPIWKDYIYNVVLDQKQLDVLTAHAAWRLESGNHPPGATMPDFVKDVIVPGPLKSIAPDRVTLP